MTPPTLFLSCSCWPSCDLVRVGVGSEVGVVFYVTWMPCGYGQCHYSVSTQHSTLLIVLYLVLETQNCMESGSRGTNTDVPCNADTVVMQESIKRHRRKALPIHFCKNVMCFSLQTNQESSIVSSGVAIFSRLG